MPRSPALRPAARRLRAGAAVPEELDHDRQDRDEDDADGHEREVVLDDRDVAEEYAGAEAQADPGDGAGDVVEHECRRRHRGRAGDERHEGPDDRHEAAEHHGLAAVAFEEVVRLCQMLAVEQPVEQARVVGRVEDARADGLAHGVVDGVAQHGGARTAGRRRARD